MNRFACSDSAMAERLLARGSQSNSSLAPEERAHWNRCRSCRIALRRIRRMSAAWGVLEPSPEEIDGACGRFEAQRQARGHRRPLVPGTVAFAVVLAAAAASASVRVLSSHFRGPAVLAGTDLAPETASPRSPQRVVDPGPMAPAPAAAPPAAAAAVSGPAAIAPALSVPVAGLPREAAPTRSVRRPLPPHAPGRRGPSPVRGAHPGTAARLHEPANEVDLQESALAGEDRDPIGREAPDRSPNERLPSPDERLPSPNERLPSPDERSPDLEPPVQSPPADRGGLATSTHEREADSEPQAESEIPGATGSGPGVTVAANPAATWSPAAAWAAAAAAMREGDRTRAELALGELVARGDARTRDAARLARAQLWVSAERRGEARVELASLASRGATAFIRARASSELERLH